MLPFRPAIAPSGRSDRLDQHLPVQGDRFGASLACGFESGLQPGYLDLRVVLEHVAPPGPAQEAEAALQTGHLADQEAAGNRPPAFGKGQAREAQWNREERSDPVDEAVREGLEDRSRPPLDREVVQTDVGTADRKAGQ